MKFATIIREAGICEKLFRECAEIDVVLYDEDDEINESDDVKFVKPLFEDNQGSLERFIKYVDELNSNLDCVSMNVLITEHYVVVHHKTPQAKSFRRTRPLDPLDIDIAG